MGKVSSRRLSAVSAMLQQLSINAAAGELDAHSQLAFEAAFATWWRQVLRKTSSRCRIRLAGGLSHASLFFLRFVWWPAFRSLTGLIPEYEIVDYKDGYRYIDFVYITNGLRIAIELDGRGPHRLHLSADEFEDELMRQNYLVLDHWLVLRFPFLMLRDKPRKCEQLLQQLLGSAGGAHIELFNQLCATEQRILACISRMTGGFGPSQVAPAAGVSKNTAGKYLRLLVDKQFISPINAEHRKIRKYSLNRDRIPFHFF
ncbi:DNA-binding response regulator [Cohnella hashimotonis]|uniref:DNA-binding response regulator n=1 Tax=Cohnella hashimotonis TaxID=2826895 RepID=A0ABT6TLU4_9BACL|nr:DNA-binding response regulator [Cohnella hashimotonis]MDI4647790.1 DNA-binding response regulator [Cohnella hashimotonis]